MRDVTTIQPVDYIPDQTTVITLDMDTIPEFDKEDYDLTEPKEFKTYILDMKRGIRGSFEYRQMINFLRENMNMNKCSFYKNVTNIDTFKIKIHLHHHPFTLEDIIRIVFTKRVFYGESTDIESVSKEVMFLHYKMMVGLIPLAETPHELVHNNYLFIPANHVRGQFEKFAELYWDFMEPELQELYERNMEFTKTYNEESSNNFILNKGYTYVDMTGEYDLPSMEHMVDIVQSRIDDINNGTETSVEIEEQPNKKELISPISFVDK